jgi:ABC-type transport system involved in multi-copper enzyme maturation permease subunit
MFWKEWRETRWKWLAFALAFHLPVLFTGLSLLLREEWRFDLYAMSDGVTAQALGLAVVIQSGFLITAGLMLLSFFAVGSVGAELENQSIFFLFERPVSRWQVLLFKYAVGAVQAATCVGLSILSTVTLVYFVMASVATNVTFAGSREAFSYAIAHGARGTVWTAFIALMVYSATFLFSVLFEKWWIAVIAGGISIAVMFYCFGEMLFEWIIERATRNTGDDEVNLDLYGQLDPVPILVMLLVSAALYFAAQYAFARKEMR